jgi:type I restriction enzyme S subunit
MSVPAYPAFKDSGVEWIEAVPNDWEVRRIGDLCVKIGSGKTPTGGADVYVPDGVLFLRSQNVYDDGLRLDDVAYISPGTDAAMASTRVLPGDILPNITGASLGRTCVVPENIGTANVNQHVCIIRVRDQRMVGYLSMAMKSPLMKAQINAAQNGAAREGLNFQQLARLAVPLPPIPDQAAIATFLDRETARIDALVAEQERLIALVKEKRLAVISHAVTKGLNPKPPMKDSGVEWIGAIPASWQVGRIKYYCREITDGAHISPETEEGLYDFVSTRDLTEDGIDFDGCLKTSAITYEYMVRTGCRPSAGDILFSKDGTIGRTELVVDDRAFVVASSLIIIRPNASLVLSSYLYWLMQSSVVVNQVECFVKGAGLPRLSIQNLMRIVGPLPPQHEQAEIASSLATYAGRFRNMLEVSRRAIELLRERRVALILAVVTGKIDVRNLDNVPEVDAAAA